MGWNDLGDWNQIGSGGAAATITAVSTGGVADTVRAETLSTFTLDNSAGTTGATVNGVAFTSYTITDGTHATAIAPRGFGTPYGSTADVVVSNGTDSAGYSVTVRVALNSVEYDYGVAYASLDPDSPWSSAGVTPNPSIVSGDSVIAGQSSPGGITPVVSSDGVVSGFDGITVEQTFPHYFYDASDNTVGTVGTITITPNFFGSFASTSTSSVSFNGRLVQHGSFDSTSTSGLSLSGALTQSGSFDSVSSTSVSFNGRLVQHGVFASVSSSALSATGKLTQKGSFNSVSVSSASFTGALDGNNAGTFSSVSTSSASFSGKLTQYGSFSSVSSATVTLNGRMTQYGSFASVSLSSFSANGTLDNSLSGSFTSTAVSAFSAIGKLTQHGSFSSTSVSSLNFLTNLHTVAPGTRTITVNERSGNIQIQTENRVITV